MRESGPEKRSPELNMRLLLMCICWGACGLPLSMADDGRTGKIPMTPVAESATPEARHVTVAEDRSRGLDPALPIRLEDQRTLLTAGQQLFNKKQYPKAREALTPLRASGFPEIKWPATYWIARAYHQQRNTDRSTPLLTEVAARYKPLAADAQYWLGQACIQRRMYASARACFEKGFALSSDDFKDDCLYQAGYAHYLDRNYKQAAGCFSKLIKKYPDSEMVKPATSFLARSQQNLHKARTADLNWVLDIGMASTSQQLRWDEGLEFGLGANGRIGLSTAWEPRDGTRLSAYGYGTRTSYLTGNLGDRQGVVAGLSVSQNMGDTRSIGYGVRYSENQRVDVSTSDTTNLGVWGSYSMPIEDDGRLGLYAALSDLRYHSVSSSGTQTSLSLSYTEPLSSSVRMAVGGTWTDSDTNAAYLAYTGPSLYGNFTKTLSKRRTLRAGISHLAMNFDAPRRGETNARADRQDRYFAEYSHQVNKKISLGVGWQENKRTSTQANLNRVDASWYLRTSRLLDLKF